MKPTSLFVVFFLCTTLSYGQYARTYPSADSLKVSIDHNDTFWKRATVPAVFFGLSAAAWETDEDVRTIRNRYIPDFRSKLDNYTQFTPGATAFALKLSGVKGRNNLGRSVINWGGGMLIMGGLVNGLKYTTRVMRPDGTSRNSFPSGHTATAFMNATFLHKEYGQVNPLFSILGYSMSTYTGISRSLNNRHWLSDILTGAGIGILSTELSYLIVDNIYKNKGDFFVPFHVKEELDTSTFVSIRIGQAFYIDGLHSIGRLGLEGALEGAYYFNKKWGVGGEIGFMHMPFEQELLDPLEDLGLPAELENPQLNIQSLGFSTMLVGGYYTYILGPKFLLQGKVLTGLGRGIGGEVNIRAQLRENESLTEVAIPLMDYIMHRSWVIGGGINLTAMAAPTLGVSLYADYKYACPQAEMWLSEYYTDVEDRFLEKERFPISALSGGVKLSIFL